MPHFKTNHHEKNILNFTDQTVTTNTTTYGCITLHIQDVIVPAGKNLTIISVGEVNFRNFDV